MRGSTKKYVMGVWELLKEQTVDDDDDDGD